MLRVNVKYDSLNVLEETITIEGQSDDYPQINHDFIVTSHGMTINFGNVVNIKMFRLGFLLVQTDISVIEVTIISGEREFRFDVEASSKMAQGGKMTSLENTAPKYSKLRLVKDPIS